MKKILKFIPITLLSLLALNCGEATVEVENISYEPRIVIEGYISPGAAVSGIKISRNFRLNQDISNTDLSLPDAVVSITDEQNGTEYALEYFAGVSESDSNYFYYPGNDLTIVSGNRYTLHVSATVEGKVLSASSTTTVPEPGFAITSVNFDSLKYRQKSDDGVTLEFSMMINRSPGTTFYVTSIEAIEYGLDNFVYNNPFNDFDPEIIEENIDRFRNGLTWLQNTPSGAGESEIRLFWSNFWFYSD